MKIVAACLLVILPAFTFAEKPSDEQVDQIVERSNAALAEPERVQCKRIRVTGSHMRRRVCQKRSQWDQLTKDSQRTMRQATDGGPIN